MTAAFKDSIAASFNADRIKKIYEQIADLEAMENDHSLVPEGINSASERYGKVLSAQKTKQIYSMKLGRDDRFMAVIIEKDNKKIYAWFWGGPHEAYNKKLNANKLKKKSNTLNVKVEEQIDEKIKELEIEAKATNKNSVMESISSVKNKHDTNKNGHHKKSKYK